MDGAYAERSSMIVIRLLGGLGNTLFQRAYGLALETRGYEVAFDKSALVEGTHREYSLGAFDVPVIFAKPSPYGKTFYERSLRFDQKMLDLPDDCTVVGYFQTEKYFSYMQTSVREHFNITCTVSQHALDIRQSMNSNSVFLHVRRQDYVGLQHYHGMPDAAYYKRALAEIQSKVSDARVYVFSDDRDWCLQNFMAYEVVQGTSKYEDLWLMSCCQHAILANSSFSWWGAWLGDNKPFRTVVAPKQWFADPSVDSSDIIPDRWVKI
jgi:hypothetical protein